MSTPLSTDQQATSVSAGSVRPRRFRLVRRRLVLLLALVGVAAGASFAIRPHVRAWYHRRAARRELQRYHTRQAIEHLLICRDIWPRDPETLLLSARAARRAKVYGDSERLLRSYREIRGRDEAYTFEQLLMAAECRVDESAGLCWKYMEEGRYNDTLLVEALTRGYLRQYRLGQAFNCLERWKLEQPDNPQVYYLEGIFRFDYAHAPSSSVASFRRAVELDADYEEARLGLAVALMHEKNFAEAAEHFRCLLRGQPDNLRVQVGLAECLDGLGESAEAARRADYVLAQQPESAPALSLRGQLALNNGELAEAERWLRQAIDYDPKDQRALYSLVLCLEKRGKEEEARQHRQQLQQLEQDMIRFNQIVTKELSERPADPALYCTMGEILLRTGERDEGLRWLQNALQVDPNYAPARQALAENMNRDRPGAVGQTAP